MAVRPADLTAGVAADGVLHQRADCLRAFCLSHAANPFALFLSEELRKRGEILSIQMSAVVHQQLPDPLAILQTPQPSVYALRCHMNSLSREQVSSGRAGGFASAPQRGPIATGRIILNIEQGISNRRSKATPHFEIRYSLFDVLRFKGASLKLVLREAPSVVEGSTLPKISNYCCLPGRAGGSPRRISRPSPLSESQTWQSAAHPAGVCKAWERGHGFDEWPFPAMDQRKESRMIFSRDARVVRRAGDRGAISVVLRMLMPKKRILSPGTSFCQ